MLIPLAVLAVGATFAGVLFRYSFIGSGAETFWENTRSSSTRRSARRPGWYR